MPLHALYLAMSRINPGENVENEFLLRDAIRVMLVRDLGALEREIVAYPDDASLWTTAPGISNSGGMLAQHLCGNLRHFIGAAFGSTGYVRNRDAEFGEHIRTRAEIRAEIQQTLADITSTLDSLPPEAAAGAFPFQLNNRSVRASVFLVHLAAHLGYHLGQIDYHRRLLTSSGGAVDALSVQELPEI